MLEVEIGKHLDAQGLVDYDETGATGNCFVAKLPQQPDQVVSVTAYGGPEADVRLGYDSPRFQVRVRGTQDPRTGKATAQAIYDELHGLHDVTLPEGTWLVGCRGLQSGPAYLGPDENGRHEYSLNFEAEVRNISAHRE